MSTFSESVAKNQHKDKTHSKLINRKNQHLTNKSNPNTSRQNLHIRLVFLKFSAHTLSIGYIQIDII